MYLLIMSIPHPPTRFCCIPGGNTVYMNQYDSTTFVYFSSCENENPAIMVLRNLPWTLKCLPSPQVIMPIHRERGLWSRDKTDTVQLRTSRICIVQAASKSVMEHLICSRTANRNFVLVKSGVHVPITDLYRVWSTQIQYILEGERCPSYPVIIGLFPSDNGVYKYRLTVSVRMWLPHALYTTYRFIVAGFRESG